MTERPAWPAELAALGTELDAVLRGSALLRRLGGELAGWGPGWAESRLPTDPTLANLAGSVHGGIVAVAADTAFEAACNSYGRMAVASSISVHFTAPAAVGTTLSAAAAELERGRRTASYRVDVTDDDGTLVAWFQALAYRTSRWHLGEERWPAEWRAQY